MFAYKLVLTRFASRYAIFKGTKEKPRPWERPILERGPRKLPLVSFAEGHLRGIPNADLWIWFQKMNPAGAGG